MARGSPEDEQGKGLPEEEAVIDDKLSGDDPRDLWRRECVRALEGVLDTYLVDPAGVGEMAIEAAERLLAIAHHIKGVACPRCGGLGQRTYPSTSLWSGGVGGMQMTNGPCDKCWGTGRTDKTGVDLRKLARQGGGRADPL